MVAMLDTETESGSTMEFDAPAPAELDEKLQTDLSDFHDLLGAIEGTNDKLKSLWKLIFENANTDRKNAYIAFVDLYMQCHGKSDQHAIHGLNISKYLERMEKSNTQLLKLAELVAANISKNEDEDNVHTKPMTSRDVFASIENRKLKK